MLIIVLIVYEQYEELLTIRKIPTVIMFIKVLAVSGIRVATPGEFTLMD